jgi:hypothetical protein
MVISIIASFSNYRSKKQEHLFLNEMARDKLAATIDKTYAEYGFKQPRLTIQLSIWVSLPDSLRGIV